MHRSRLEEGQMMRLAAIAAICGCALGSALACGVLADAALPEASPVMIDSFAFGPRDLTVGRGTRVIWTNKDDAPHTVVASAKLFRSHALDTNDSFSFTFDDPGTYAYFCSLHPFMTGTIVVEAAEHNRPR
jgi:plastocyanin